MTKIMKFSFGIVCTVLCICLFGCSTADEHSSKAIEAKMSAVLHGNESDISKLWTIHKLDLDLAMAYNNEKQPYHAIDILQRLIEENRHPHDPFYGTKWTMSVANYGMEAIYYRELAKSYALLKDAESEKKALKKAEQATALQDKLRPIESAKDQAAEKKKKAAILN
jgi:hypothetical protein